MKKIGNHKTFTFLSFTFVLFILSNLTLLASDPPEFTSFIANSVSRIREIGREYSQLEQAYFQLLPLYYSLSADQQRQYKPFLDNLTSEMNQLLREREVITRKMLQEARKY